MRSILLGMCFILLGISSLQGQEKRNFLEKSLKGQELTELKPIQYPGYTDRDFWDALPSNVRETARKKAEKVMNVKLENIPLTAYLEFVRKGNRKDCDALDARQRAWLQDLVVGELVEGKGRFLDAIINHVWALCERSTWVGTAHLASQKKGAGVPDRNDVIIDLHSGEVSALLAWTYYFFKEQFDEVSPLISQRILQELDERTLQPYLRRDNLWWMGFRGGLVNNWNVWCNYNVMMTALLTQTDLQLKRQIVEKTMKSVDCFINYYKEDGGCEEGASYWGHAPGNLLGYLEALREATGGKVDLFHEPLICKMGAYIANVHVDSCWFINFADASAKNNSLPTVIYRFGKNTGNTDLMAFGKYLGDLARVEENPLQGNLGMVLNNFLIWEEFSQYPGKAPAFRSVWMEGIEVAAGREKENSSQGLFFAAKGGYNDESHNHNDVGTFVLYKNGKPVIVDAGVGTYTAKTFSSRRYEIWNMQSLWHNLPVINGQAQAFGRQYRSADVRFSDRGKQLTFALDLSKAYPVEAACKRWERIYTFTRGKALKVTDRYQFSEQKGKSCLHFLTHLPVKVIQDGVVGIGEGKEEVRMIYDPREMKLELEEKILDDQALRKVWGDKLVRIRLTYQKTGLQGQSEVVFR